MFPLPSSDQSAQIEVATAGEVLRERHQQPASVLYLDSGRVLLGVREDGVMRHQLGVVEGPFWLDAATALLEQLLLTRVRDLPAAALSGGQKKLLGIVCALMGDPRLLMLDEPTAGVHPNLRRDIVAALQRLNAQGMTLVIVEHDMHFIRELCSRCIVLDRGEIIADCPPAELAENERVVEAYLGKSVERPKVLS